MQGFSDFLFKQYLNEGHLTQLLSFSKEFPTELGSFLESHVSLSWLHDFATQDYNKVNILSRPDIRIAMWRLSLSVQVLK